MRKKQSKKVKIKIHTHVVDDYEDAKNNDLNDDYYNCSLEKCLTPEAQRT